MTGIRSEARVHFVATKSGGANLARCWRGGPRRRSLSSPPWRRPSGGTPEERESASLMDFAADSGIVSSSTVLRTPSLPLEEHITSTRDRLKFPVGRGDPEVSSGCAVTRSAAGRLGNCRGWGAASPPIRAIPQRDHRAARGRDLIFFGRDHTGRYEESSGRVVLTGWRSKLRATALGNGCSSPLRRGTRSGRRIGRVCNGPAFATAVGWSYGAGARRGSTGAGPRAGAG